MTDLVFGGSGGIGSAVVDLLRERDYDVHSTDRDECDVRELNEVHNLIGSIKPDRIVYAVGVNYLSWIQHISGATFDAILQANLIGFARVIQYAAVLDYGPVNVVAVSSDAAVRPMRTSLMYCASKAALDMAVKCAARELAPIGWRVNAVSPGMVEGTDMTLQVDQQVMQLRGWSPEKAREYERSQIPMQRRALPKEIAEVVCDVLGGPAYLNGAIIPVNGGR
jgi:NAD(P)-dependent dehydrogenase (short-subunit alcohol dehydrogenase family)